MFPFSSPSLTDLVRPDSTPGIHVPTPDAHSVSIDVWSQTMNVNARGTFAFCKHFLALVATEQERDAPPGGYSIVYVAFRLYVRRDHDRPLTERCSCLP